jgi:hypothetical protein
VDVSWCPVFICCGLVMVGSTAVDGFSMASSAKFAPGDADSHPERTPHSNLARTLYWTYLLWFAWRSRKPFVLFGLFQKPSLQRGGSHVRGQCTQPGSFARMIFADLLLGWP